MYSFLFRFSFQRTGALSATVSRRVVGTVGKGPARRLPSFRSFWTPRINCSGSSRRRLSFRRTFSFSSFTRTTRGERFYTQFPLGTPQKPRPYQERTSPLSRLFDTNTLSSPRGRVFYFSPSYTFENPPGRYSDRCTVFGPALGVLKGYYDIAVPMSPPLGTLQLCLPTCFIVRLLRSTCFGTTRARCVLARSPYVVRLL